MSKYLIIDWLYHFISVHCPWEAKRQFSIISKTASRPLLVCGFGPQDGYLPPLFADQEVSCRHPICGQFVEETKEKISRKVGWKWCFEPNRTKTRPERAKKGKLPSPKIHPFFWQNLWPLYFTSVFLYSVLVSLPGLYFISACASWRLLWSSILLSRGYFSSPPPFGQITALLSPVL